MPYLTIRNATMKQRAAWLCLSQAALMFGLVTPASAQVRFDLGTCS